MYDAWRDDNGNTEMVRMEKDITDRPVYGTGDSEEFKMTICLRMNVSRDSVCSPHQ